MDVLALLCDRVTKLPFGDYTTGLNAIIRHVKAGIRHLERDLSHDLDSCTDVIYRTNQAYEGSLKEAYRVLANKDPSGLSLFDIEQYLETHNIVRPRVLDQLTRYRRDYRNPSTHDYKLDFDEDEALLAILSVCGFACLLVNQIVSKLASDQAVKDTAPAKAPANKSLSELGEVIAKTCLSYTAASADVGWFEYENGIEEVLVAIGFQVRQIKDIEEALWDFYVKRNGDDKFGIETRVASAQRINRDAQDLTYIPRLLKEEGMVGGLLILRDDSGVAHNLYSGIVESKPFYLIAPEDDISLKVIEPSVNDFAKLTNSS